MRLPVLVPFIVSVCALAWSPAASAGGPFRVDRTEFADTSSPRAQTAPPVKPKPTPLPDVIPYRGGPVLPGYVLRDHDDYLTRAGWATFGVAYIVPIVGSAALAASCEEPPDQRGEGYCAGPDAMSTWMFLPVAGPGLWAGGFISNAVQDKGSARGTQVVLGTLLSLDTIAQVTGIVMIVEGALSPSHDMVKVKHDSASLTLKSWYVSPVMFDTRGSWGGVAGGRF